MLVENGTINKRGRNELSQDKMHKQNILETLEGRNGGQCIVKERSRMRKGETIRSG